MVSYVELVQEEHYALVDYVVVNMVTVVPLRNIAAAVVKVSAQVIRPVAERNVKDIVGTLLMVTSYRMAIPQIVALRFQIVPYTQSLRVEHHMVPQKLCPCIAGSGFMVRFLLKDLVISICKIAILLIALLSVSQAQNIKIYVNTTKCSKDTELEIVKRDFLLMKNSFEFSRIIKPNSVDTLRLALSTPCIIEVNRELIFIDQPDSVNLMFSDQAYNVVGKFPGNYTIWREIDNIRYHNFTEKLTKLNFPVFKTKIDSVYLLRKKTLLDNKRRISTEVYVYMEDFIKYNQIFFLLKSVDASNAGDFKVSDFTSIALPEISFSDFREDKYSDMLPYVLAGQSLMNVVALNGDPSRFDYNRFLIALNHFEKKTQSVQLRTLFSNTNSIQNLKTHELDTVFYRLKNMDLDPKDFRIMETIYNEAKMRGKPINKEMQLKTTLISFYGEQVKLEDVLEINKGQLVLFDFWASWCSPCIQALPKVKELKEKGENLKIIYISLDDDLVLWRDAAKKNAIMNDQFLLNDNFKSFFAKYLNLHSIPRYVLIGKNGSIIDTDTPMPGTIEFDKILK